MAYSSGFSPHPKISYANAAPTGTASEAEYVEIALQERVDPDEVRERLDAAFRSRTRAEWEDTFAGLDACVAPVLAPGEAPSHPHHRARGTFVEVGESVQPAPAPRFGRTPAAEPQPGPHPGRDTEEILTEAGFSAAEITGFRQAGAVA